MIKLHNFSLAKVFISFVVLLSLLNFTKIFSNPSCMAGQSISTKTLHNFKDTLLEEQGLIEIDYVKGILNRCQYHSIQEDIITRRLTEWQALILDNQSSSDLDKVEKVNRFFNRLDFLNDIDHWGEEDYWATPVEFIVCQTGDCEDFSIAKYITLYAMGVSEEKLSLTYVKALEYNSHHMVLTYYSKSGAEPLILDNIVDIAKPASERSDLIPIYSINGTSLWLAELRGRGKLVGGRGKLAGNSNRIKKWRNLLKRLPEKKI